MPEACLRWLHAAVQLIEFSRADSGKTIARKCAWPVLYM
eukprot:COSAG01_NODE_620_length_14784_cov_49.916718_9_plen_39_part_00